MIGKKRVCSCVVLMPSYTVLVQGANLGFFDFAPCLLRDLCGLAVSSC